MNLIRLKYGSTDNSFVCGQSTRLLPTSHGVGIRISEAGHRVLVDSERNDATHSTGIETVDQTT